jgi:TetR/AcrR family fatty acid metabolism transcriptional regulator
LSESAFRSEPARARKGNGNGARARAAAQAAGAGDKRERILRAAVKVFARKGFHGARVAEVARAAGVADGTIYLYFKNKEDLLLQIFTDRLDGLLAQCRRSLGDEPTPEARLRKIILLQLGLLEEHRDLAEVITVNIRQSKRILQTGTMPRFVEYLDTIAEVVAEGQAKGALRKDVSPRVVARSLFGALDGLTLTWALGRAEPGGLTRAAGQIADVFIEGLRVAPEAP